MLTVDNIRKKTEVWFVMDERLPTNDKIVRTPPDDDFLNSIAEVQLQPIGICFNDQEGWKLGFGRKRILAIRKLYDEGTHDGMIDVTIFYGLSPSDAEILSLIENNHRSVNEIGDYSVISNMLKQGMDYKQIAHSIGIPLGTVKAIDRKWANVPKWAVDACLDGEIAPSTALEIGKVKPDTQKVLKKELNDEGKLSAKRVKDEKKAIQNDTLVAMSPGLGFSQRDFYSRAELEEVRKILASGTKAKALEYIDSLLAE